MRYIAVVYCRNNECDRCSSFVSLVDHPVWRLVTPDVRSVVQRRRRVWRFKGVRASSVISGCLPPPFAAPLYEKISADFYVLYGPHWTAQEGSGPSAVHCLMSLVQCLLDFTRYRFSWIVRSKTARACVAYRPTYCCCICVIYLCFILLV